MNYEKKYKKAVEKIRNLLDEGDKKGYTIVTYKKDFESIFPELKESEDEKIRKELIKHLKELSAWKEDEVIPVKNPSYYRQWASWLEKQGQVKESTISQHENKMCKENGNSLTCEDEKVRREIINYFQCQSEEEPTRKEIHDKWIAWLEKQKEYESTDFEYVWDRTDCGELTAALDKYSEEAIINMCHAWYDKGIELERKSWLGKQGETFPVLSNSSNIGKDEQKPLGYVHHIDEDGYYTKEAILEPNPYTGTGFDYNGHHWGMCARDGGVEILMDGNITSRVFPDKNNIIEQKPTDSYCQENCNGFQETGKCFADGECKAKREAEQKPVIKFKTAEESLGISSDEYNKIVDECLFGEQKLTEFERGLFDMLTDISKPCTADCVKSHSEKLLSIARKMIALEQKPEENKGNLGGISPNWSEEDDGVLLESISVLQNNCHWVLADKLKSLKDRVGCEANCTTTKEWSEEDECYLSECIGAIATKDGWSFEEKRKTKHWLKSLKDRVQPKQEWSEEDERMIRGLLAICDEWTVRHSFYPKENSDMEKLKNWLKSIRPQNHWKPSDVQMNNK